MPRDVVALYSWADGQEPDAPWWPVLESGRFLPVAEAASHYRWLRDEAKGPAWYRLLLPLAHDGWYQVGVELVPGRSGAVVDYGFGDQPRVLAPTLAVMLDVTAEMVEAGIGFPGKDEDARIWRSRRTERMERRSEWERWPYERLIDLSGDNWPPHWRAAVEG